MSLAGSTAFPRTAGTLDDPEASFPSTPQPTTPSWLPRPALDNATSVDLATGCSFCGKPRPQLRKLIAGPGVYICDECVALCVEILEEEIGESWREEAEQRLSGENQDED